MWYVCAGASFWFYSSALLAYEIGLSSADYIKLALVALAE